MANGHHF